MHIVHNALHLALLFKIAALARERERERWGHLSTVIKALVNKWQITGFVDSALVLNLSRQLRKPDWCQKKKTIRIFGDLENDV